MRFGTHGALQVLPVKTPFDNRLAQDMAVNRGGHLLTRGVRAQVELGVERKEFEGVVVVNTARARAPITDRGALHLNSAIGKRWLRRDAFRKTGSVAGNVERHPVQRVLKMF